MKTLHPEARWGLALPHGVLTPHNRAARRSPEPLVVELTLENLAWISVEGQKISKDQWPWRLRDAQAALFDGEES